MKQKILLTGIKGFIGHHCYNYLKDEYDIIGIDNCSGLAHDEREVPYTHENLLTCKLPDVDVVLHLAAKAGVKESWLKLEDYYNSNVVVTKRIFDHYTKAKIVYASSSSVIDLMSPYAMTKAMCETMAPSNAIGMRFFTVYGPSSRPDMLYRMAMEDKLTYITQHQRDFTHINTLLPLIKAVIQKGKEGHVYEMGEGNPETVEQFLKRINYTKDVPFKEVTGESEYTCSKPFTI